MASSHKTKNQIEMQFEMSYDKGSELFVCVVATLDKGTTN
jgi:hypothetical protein